MSFVIVISSSRAPRDPPPHPTPPHQNVSVTIISIPDRHMTDMGRGWGIPGLPLQGALVVNRCSVDSLAFEQAFEHANALRYRIPKT